jgi:hypothetical protein
LFIAASVDEESPTIPMGLEDSSRNTNYSLDADKLRDMKYDFPSFYNKHSPIGKNNTTTTTKTTNNF